MKLRFSMCLAMAFALAGCHTFMVDIPVNQTGGTSAPAPCTQNTYFLDGDDDTFGKIGSEYSACSPMTPSDVLKGGDCDDTAKNVHPGASEQCDGLDNDCNGTVDDTTKSWALDHDGDGHGDPKFVEVGACTGNQPWLVASADDCDDNDPKRFPGNPEVCDGIDNNCNNETDEGVTTPFYADVDGDTHGDAAKIIQACKPSTGIVIKGDDCDDSDKTVYPGAPELCDSKDNNCDGFTDENVELTFFKDDDGDSYGDPAKKVQACSVPAGATITSNDCNDSVKAIHPGAAEVCDNIDNNCNGLTDEDAKLSFYFDQDGDGYAGAETLLLACTAPKGYYPDANDCDDKDSTMHPGAKELCDGKDNTCSGKINEPDSLCDDGDSYTTDVCGGVSLCSNLPDTLVFTCTKQEYMADGKTKWPSDSSCGLEVFYQLSQVYTDVAEKLTQVTLNMEDVCKELQSNPNLTLNTNGFMQLSDDYPLNWIGGIYVDLTRMSANKNKSPVKIGGTPGNVTKVPEVDNVYTAKDLGCE